MTRLALLLPLLLMACLCFGGPLPLAWDYPYPGFTNLGGFYLYGATSVFTANSLTSAPVKIDCGTNQVMSIDCKTNSGQWYFTVTAYGNDTNRFESVMSNILPLEFAGAPTNMRMVVVQYSYSIAGTNWQDIGFLRVKSGPP